MRVIMEGYDPSFRAQGYVIEVFVSLLISLIISYVLAQLIHSIATYAPQNWLAEEILGDVITFLVLFSYVITLISSISAKLHYVRGLYKSFMYYVNATAELDMWDFVIVTMIWLICTLPTLASLL